jgi:PIN domain nuclease of toxin-antitoxin system
VRYLLDTHAVLWAGLDPARLGPAAREVMEDPGNDLLLSVASTWEMAIKRGLGKLSLRMPLAQLVATALARPGYRLAAIELRHTLAVEGLPPHHRDPFDRLLVAQALTEGWPIVSQDTAFDAYGIERVW